jgi:hypothetical protein
VPRRAKPPKDFFRLPFPNDARVTDGRLDISDFPKPGRHPLASIWCSSTSTRGRGLRRLLDDRRDDLPLLGRDRLRNVHAENVWIVDVTPSAGGRQYARGLAVLAGAHEVLVREPHDVRNGPDSPFRRAHDRRDPHDGIRSKAGDAPAVGARHGGAARRSDAGGTRRS